MKNELNQTVTQSRFAEMIGVSEARVSQLASDGVITSGATAGQWLLDYCHRLREQAAGRLGSEVGGLDLSQERAQLARHQSGIAELRLAEMRGELIRVDAVQQVLAGTLAGTRDRLLTVADRVAPIVAAETDPAAVHQAVYNEIHQALAQLAGAPLAIDRAAQDVGGVQDGED